MGEVSHRQLKVMAKELNDERKRASANTEETITASRAKDQIQKKLHEALAEIAAKDQIQKKLHEALAEIAELKGELLAKAQEHDESREKTDMAKTNDAKKIQSLTDKLKRSEMKLLDSQANETNAREMIDILNATLEKQKQVSGNSKELYLAHQKLHKAEADNAALKARHIEMRQTFDEKVQVLKESLHMQAEDIRAFNTEKPRTEDIGSQTQLAPPDDSPLNPTEDLHDPQSEGFYEGAITPTSSPSTTMNISHQEQQEHGYEPVQDTLPPVSLKENQDVEDNASQEDNAGSSKHGHESTPKRYLSSPHWGSDSSTRSEPETQDAEGNASQEDNAGFLNSCINRRYHCYKRKQITTGEVSCSICNSKLTESRYCGHCETCDDVLCVSCMKKYDYKIENVCADFYYQE